MSVAGFPYIALVLLLSPCYALCPRGGRPWFLLAASLAFYGSFNLGFLVILLGVILATYCAGLTLEGDRGRPWLLGLWIAAVLTPLLFYKYFLVWFGARLTELVPVSALSFGGYGSVLIPVGLSFFTFQSLGYIIDIHRKQYRAERDLAHLALFISFFPQLLAGPIERFPALTKQLRAVDPPTPEMVLEGLLMLFYGLFLKISLGDRLGTTVDAVFEAPERVGAAAALVGLYGFAIQLFADFAGYSFIALGAAALFGVRLTQNFKQPYFSASIVEFWQRWHISLTRWIGDYLYRPLGLKLVAITWLPRLGQEAMTFLIVWVVLGLWHGASWTFVVFGLLQAAMMLGYSRWKRGHRGVPSRLRVALGIFITFNLVVVSFGLIRAPTLDAFGALLSAVASLEPGPVKIVDKTNTTIVLVIVLGVEALRRYAPQWTLAGTLWPRCLAIAALILMTMMLGHDANRSFIYFRF